MIQRYSIEIVLEHTDHCLGVHPEASAVRDKFGDYCKFDDVSQLLEEITALRSELEDLRGV